MPLMLQEAAVHSLSSQLEFGLLLVNLSGVNATKDESLTRFALEHSPRERRLEGLMLMQIATMCTVVDPMLHSHRWRIVKMLETLLNR